MKSHITFDSIDCENLQYVKTSKSWVCLAAFDDLKCVDTCMRCRFLKKACEEVGDAKLVFNAIYGYNSTRAERRAKLNGRLL